MEEIKKDFFSDHNSENEQLARQLERGSFFMHTVFSKHAVRINEIEPFLYAIIDVLINKGIISDEELKQTIKKVRNELAQKGELANPQIVLRTDNTEEDTQFTPVNCNERMHICHAVCCQLHFPLSVEEVESGMIRWDLGRPYMIRQEKNCYCTHINPASKKCNVYDHRPSVCKKYSCAKDNRIWKDFEKMELNNEWINENIKESRPQFARASMIVDQTEPK